MNALQFYPSIESKRLIKYYYLVFWYSRQSVHSSNMPASLTLVWQCVHDELQSCLAFSCGWWEAHGRWHVWHEGCEIQLGKVYRCVLTRACEHNTGQHVNELITCLQTLWKLMIYVTFSDREAIVVNFFYPGLYFIILGNVIIWLIENADDFLDEIWDGCPQAKPVIPNKQFSYCIGAF